MSLVPSDFESPASCLSNLCQQTPALRIYPTHTPGRQFEKCFIEHLTTDMIKEDNKHTYTKYIYRI